MTLPQITTNAPFRTIPLTRGKVTKVSPEDFDSLSKFKWHVTKTEGGPFYARRCQWKKGGGGTTISMARVITGAGAGQIVDHINGDGLDNRRENLRVGNTSMNNQNLAVHRNGKLIGVYKDGTQWCAKIEVDGKSLYLARFTDPKEAHKAFRVAEKVRNVMVEGRKEALTKAADDVIRKCVEAYEKLPQDFCNDGEYSAMEWTV